MITIRRIFAWLERVFAAAGFAEAGQHEEAQAILHEQEQPEYARRRLFRETRAIAARSRSSRSRAS